MSWDHKKKLPVSCLTRERISQKKTKKKKDDGGGGGGGGGRGYIFSLPFFHTPSRPTTTVLSVRVRKKRTERKKDRNRIPLKPSQAAIIHII